MPDSVDSLSLIAELVAWIGGSLGTLLLLIGVVPMLLSRRWVRVEGVVIESGAAATVYRWRDTTGEMQEGEADGEAPTPGDPGDEVALWADPWREGRARTDSPRNDGKALRVAGLVLIAVAVIAVIASTALMFL